MSCIDFSARFLLSVSTKNFLEKKMLFGPLHTSLQLPPSNRQCYEHQVELQLLSAMV